MQRTCNTYQVSNYLRSSSEFCSWTVARKVGALSTFHDEYSHFFHLNGLGGCHAGGRLGAKIGGAATFLQHM